MAILRDCRLFCRKIQSSGSLTYGGRGDGRAVHVFPTQRRTMSLVTILIIVILVLLAIYLFQRVF
jgi:uncharacterized protein HemY